MYSIVTILLLTSSTMVMGQLPGTQTPEVHPPLPWQQCQKGGQCTTVHGEIVLDSQWRWAHDSHGKDCFANNKWDPTLCPDDATCAKNCALDGANYKSIGVTTSGNALHQEFGTRLYLMSNTSHYETFHVLGQEFSFDVDISTLKCGMNGAIYLVAMDSDGGEAKYPTNKAGAKYGTGYCDSQCPRDVRFVNAIGGNGKQGACCAEMDLWEANKESTVMTLHPCSPSPYHMCSGDACSSVCDGLGCDFNSYRLGNTSFYGPGKTVDTNKVFTVVTQFITSDGTASGALIEIRRFYIQGGHVIPNSVSKVAGVSGSSVTQEFCVEKAKAFNDQDSFTERGGLKQMGEGIKGGMVLAFALWDDSSPSHMLWLDGAWPKDVPASQPGVARGPCSSTSGVPSEIESPKPHIVFSNIRVGPINSTFTH